jgi:hypothetical protein
MRILSTALLLLTLSLPPAIGADEKPAMPAPPTVTVPSSVKVAVGRMASVPITSTGKDTRWVADTDLDVFREFDPNPAVIRLRLIAYKEGTFRMLAWTCAGDVLSEPAVCTITVGESPGPGPGPGPGPDPGPGPGPGPDPFGSRAAGLKVLILVESADISKLPKDQVLALTAADVRAYLNAHCAPDADGKTKSWRIWDKDINTSAESAMWQKVTARPHPTLPWIVISNGKTWYEGALPATKDAVMTLLQKYGGQ